MASIRKSFSFRNGVQVDEDNFIVNANGLVGIGTSIPNEALGLPGITTTRDNGKKAVRYERLVPLLTQAIKELEARVKTLESS